MPRPQRKPRKVLLVEGRDDREVIYQLCNRCSIDNRSHFEVVAYEGFDDLRTGFQIELKTDRETIGILADADADLGARWQSLRDVLVSHCGDRVPARPEAAGLVLASESTWEKRCGVWVMPDNCRSGMLESFLLELIPDDDELLVHARRAIGSLPRREFIERHRDKAEIHIWLAWQKEPGTPLGLAMKRRYLAADHALGERLRDWLLALFEIPGAPAPGTTGE